MIHFDHYISGAVFGIRYGFDDVGEGIPRHAHGAALAHNVIVLQGSVEFAAAGVTEILHAGEVFDFDWSAPHAITAVEPDTVILNLLLNGMPAEYAEMPESDRHGVA